MQISLFCHFGGTKEEDTLPPAGRVGRYRGTRRSVYLLFVVMAMKMNPAVAANGLSCGFTSTGFTSGETSYQNKRR